MNNKPHLNQRQELEDNSPANDDDLLIEHVTPFIEKLPRDKPCTAKKMFDKAVWETAPTHFGERIACLVRSGRLPLADNGKLSNNTRSYWITLR